MVWLLFADENFDVSTRTYLSMEGWNINLMVCRYRRDCFETTALRVG